MRRFPRIRCLSATSVLLAAVLFLPTVSFAQSVAGAVSLQIPIDARMEGMGGAYGPLSTGAFASWYNVAGLGFTNGLHVGFSTMQLVPDFADDVHLRYASVAYGKNISCTVPLNVGINLNYNKLNYGESILTDPGSPEPIGVVEPTESTVGLSGGVGLANIVSVGAGVKFFSADFKVPVDDPAQPSATTWDYGVQLKSPELPGRRSDGSQPDWNLVARGGIGWSNNGGDLEFLEGRPADPMPFVRREAVGGDFMLFPAETLIPEGNGWVADQMRKEALFTISGALGRETELTSGNHGKINQRGLEITLLGFVSVRKGHVNDQQGQVVGTTNGVGINVFGYAGVDYASIPQFGELDRVKKYSFWVRIPLGS